MKNTLDIKNNLLFRLCYDNMNMLSMRNCRFSQDLKEMVFIIMKFKLVVIFLLTLYMSACSTVEKPYNTDWIYKVKIYNSASGTIFKSYDDKPISFKYLAMSADPRFPNGFTYYKFTLYPEEVYRTFQYRGLIYAKYRYERSYVFKPWNNRKKKK